MTRGRGDRAARDGSPSMRARYDFLDDNSILRRGSLNRRLLDALVPQEFLLTSLLHDRITSLIPFSEPLRAPACTTDSIILSRMRSKNPGKINKQKNSISNGRKCFSVLFV